MSDADYIAIACADRTWMNIVAPFAIENMVLTIENEIIAGRMIAGETDIAGAVQIIRERIVLNGEN
jgi:hypothetical protein